MAFTIFILQIVMSFLPTSFWDIPHALRSHVQPEGARRRVYRQHIYAMFRRKIPYEVYSYAVMPAAFRISPSFRKDGAAEISLNWECQKPSL